MSYTLLEQYKLKGSISDIDLENMLESHHALSEQVAEIGSDILGDSKAVFVEEGCLQNQIDALQDVFDKMYKGPNRTAIKHIIENLKDKQDQLVNSSEYGLEELKKVNERWCVIYNNFE